MTRRWILMLAAFVLAGPALAGDGIPVVATFSVIGDMLVNIGGDRVELKTIVGPGGDCRALMSRRRQMSRTVAAARAIFINDLKTDEFEPWLEPLLKQAAFKGAKIVVSRGAAHANGRGGTSRSHGKQLPAAIDREHAWLDPHNSVIYVRNIAEALARDRSERGRGLSGARGCLRCRNSSRQRLGAKRDRDRARRQSGERSCRTTRFSTLPMLMALHCSR